MPLFLTDEEFSRCSNDAVLVAEKADAFIRSLLSELETVKAKADASDITAEQNCLLIEQKYLSVTAEFSNLESQHAQLQSRLGQTLSELGDIQALKKQFELQSVEKDGEVERLRTELKELHKSKSQLIEIVGHKDSELSEKNATIKNYLDKIVSLSETAAMKEARLCEVQAELVRSQATCSRLTQEKELIQRHNTLLNDELNSKIESLNELRRKNSDLEADMASKLNDVERRYNECSKSLQWNKDRVKELEAKLKTLHEEFCSAKDAAAVNEDRLSAELSTVNKLNELYKESSEEWSKKAAELEGVVKAMELHLGQVENDYKARLEKEECDRKQLEKDTDDLKAKLERCEAEIENHKKKNELTVAPLSSFTADMWLQSFNTDNDKIEDENLLVPKIPVGVSGTALAASLLRDGWTLVKMYEKFQEAVDALRHEQLGRKEAETVLQRVLYELEEKAEAILDERAEHEKMSEAYSMINQKLQDSLSEKANMEKTLQELKAALKRQERDLNFAHKEVGDLQKQVTVLLKECRDVQLRCGGSDRFDDTSITMLGQGQADTDDVIAEHLLTFKDINGLVEQNVRLRSTVRSLSDQIDKREREFKDNLDMELRKYTEEAASKVAAVLRRAEEQERMIESLHTSVVMYKKLYEEEHKLRSSETHASEVPSAGRVISISPLTDTSLDAAKTAQEQALERVRCLEEELTKYRTEIISLKSERDKLILEANFSLDRLERMERELQHQKAEASGILARNVEFSQLVVDYQRKLRESAESLRSAEELSRKLSLEVSAVKQEKEIVLNAEKRASDEVYSLSQRLHRLQASMETLQSAEENREEARASERRKLEEYIEKLEREWAEAKKELIQERENARALTTFTSDREQTMSSAVRQVEELRKELANAVHAHMSAESRAAVAEAKLSDFEKKIRSTDKAVTVDSRNTPSDMTTTDAVTELLTARDEIERLKEEVQANKAHMQQYKSIAQVNEDALKQVELAHENFKTEAENLKKSLEADIVSLRERVAELEHESSSKSAQLSSLAAEKEEALASTKDEIKNIKEELLIKMSQISTMEVYVSSLKEDLDKENQRWRAAQNNYERQVILQSETIQELKKTSEALALLQEESSELRKLVDTLKKENGELKAKWEVEKTMLEESKSEAEKKFNEINEQNKILHSRLEAFHIQRAEKERKLAGLSSENTSADTDGGESDLQIVINYLRRQKEIAETELSLLRKEKLRLQSQLEKALKDAEAACALLESERAKSRSLFTEEEMKSLQLQVREINLLRESNIQLREENKYNYEECQKLRTIAEKARMDLEDSEKKIKEKDIEVANCKNEIEALKLEKDHLQQRVSELLERCKNVDVEDYDRMKSTVQELQDKLKEKDTQMEESIKLSTGRLERLEQDLSSCRQELADRENRINSILQVEANLRMQIDKGRLTINSYKKKVESLSKVRDTMLKEKEDLSKENQALSRQKEEIIKENQDLLRQLEEVKQAKRSMGDTTGEKGMKEEKDTRIQTLEKILERQKEDLKKEREDNRMERARRLKTEKAIKDSYTNVDQEKSKIVSELEKHKQAVKRLSDEFEKLKNVGNNLPEGTNVVQLLSGSTLDDLGVAYVSAVENFEKEANLVFIEFAARAIQSEAPSADSSAGPAIPVNPSAVVSSLPPVASMPEKVVEESEKRTSVPKTNVEIRKSARKLVRPRLVKPEEPQGGIEMSEAEGTQTGSKYVPSSGVEDPNQLVVSSQPLARKRLAPSSTSELHEESAMVGETSSEAAVSVGKKAKATDPSQEDAVGQAMASEEMLETHPVPEESIKLSQGLNEDVDEGEREDGGVAMKIDDSEEQDSVDGKTQIETEDEKTNTVEENLDQPGGADIVPDDQRRGGPDSQQLILDSVSDREEGELLPDVVDLEGGSDVANLVENQEIEGQAGATPEPSPSRIDDDFVEAGEINSPELQNDDKGDESNVEETAEGSEKFSDGNEPMSTDGDPAADPAPVASENVSASVIVETSSAKPAPATPGASSSITAEAEEVKQVSPVTSTTINLTERAKERAELRRISIRGRARPPTRGRIPPPRGGRGGRRQPPGNI